MTDPADEHDGGPPTSEPPTEIPDDLIDPGPDGEAEEDDHHHVPADLLELHEVLEFQAAIDAEATP